VLLETNRSEYWLGEPVILRVRICNWAIPTSIILGSFGLQGKTDLRIIHEGDTSEPYHAHFEPGLTSNRSIRLPYGKAYEFRIPIEYDPNSPVYLALSAPGTYQLQLTQYIEYTNLTNPAQHRVPCELSAQTTDLRVVAPPAEGAQAWNLLQSLPDAVRDLNRLMASPSTRDILEKVAKEYPRSRYAPYCLHALGSLSLNLISSLPEEKEKAEWAYKQVIEHYPEYPLRDEVSIHLGKLYYQTGRVNAAMEIAERLLGESEDNLYRYREAEIMLPYRGPVHNPNAATNMTSWELFGTTQLPDTYAQLPLEQIK
jgi:tetratricopeptide (TPR) repeat protein